MFWICVTAYAVIGVIAGVLGARYEYERGALPDDVGSAGAVGVFTGAFWPLVGLMLLMGAIAKAMRRTGRAAATIHTIHKDHP